MPAWIKTARDEKAWQKAKGIVSKQRDKSEDEFTDRDWGLVTHIAKNLLSKGKTSASYPVDDGTLFALARVERILDTRRKENRRDKDSLLSASDQGLVSALSQVAALSGQTISAMRYVQASNLSAPENEALTLELQAVATRLRDILSKVKS